MLDFTDHRPEPAVWRTSPFRSVFRKPSPQGRRLLYLLTGTYKRRLGSKAKHSKASPDAAHSRGVRVYPGREAVLEEINENTVVIPGHGSVGTYQDFEEYVSMLKIIRLKCLIVHSRV